MIIYGHYCDIHHNEHVFIRKKSKLKPRQRKIAHIKVSMDGNSLNKNRPAYDLTFSLEIGNKHFRH